MKIVNFIISDTGERFGIIPSDENRDVNYEEDFDLILLGENGFTAEISDDEDSESDIQSSKQILNGKGDAASWLARMEGTRTMAKKIAGEHEITKFWEEYKKYQSIGEHGIRDWSSMATAWNLFVCEREKKKENDVIKYYRKQSHMLESFFDSGGKSNNIKATLQPHVKSIGNLMREQKTPVVGPSTSLDAPGPKATHGPNSDTVQINDFSQMVPLVPLHMSYATILMNQKSGLLVYPGQLEQTPAKNEKKRPLDRALQLCITCGHFRQHNRIHNGKHIVKCAVQEDAYSTDRSIKGWCSCPECKEGAEKVGYSKPDIMIKNARSLKTCKKCGHYKDYGYFSDNHSNTECSVLEENYAMDKYKGYCKCKKCISTALLRGKEKPPKLRKLYQDT